MTRVGLAVAAVAAVAVAACGGGSGAASTASRVSVAPKSAKAATTTTATTTRTAPSVPPKTTSTGAVDVRLPATFTITARGTLLPPTVGAPAGVAVQLSVISGDHKPHRVVVGGRVLSVSAGGSASALLSHLGKGTHPVLVDGAKRATLVIGVQPGP